MAQELFTQQLVPIYTWNQIFSGQVSPSAVGQEGTDAKENIISGARIIGGVLDGASFRSAETGARVEIFPEQDTTIGFVSYAGDNSVVFKTIVSGDDVGDVIIGNYAGGQGIKWDQSAGTLDVQGGITVDSLDIPDTTTANSFHVNTAGDAWWGAVAIGDAVAKVLKTGAATFTSATITNSTYNASSLTLQDLFGNGSSDVTISIDTSLTADTYYNDLTINSGITLSTNGYRVFVKGTLTNNGTISRSGSNGTAGGNASGMTGGIAGTAGAAINSGSMFGGSAGQDGTAGFTESQGGGVGGQSDAGTNGDSIAKGLAADGKAGLIGGTGGNGAANAGGAGGTPGTAGTRTGTVFNTINNVMAAYYLYDTLPSADILRSSAGCGGSSGGGGGGGNLATSQPGGGGGAGGGGSSGGLLVIFARTLTNNGTIEANGGVGGNGGNGGNGAGSGGAAAGGGGGGSGGSGGAGGVIILCYVSLTAGTIQVNGGNGGTKGTGGTGQAGSYTATNGSDGSDGTVGNAGQIHYLQV